MGIRLRSGRDLFFTVDADQVVGSTSVDVGFHYSVYIRSTGESQHITKDGGETYPFNVLLTRMNLRRHGGNTDRISNSSVTGLLCHNLKSTAKDPSSCHTQPVPQACKVVSDTGEVNLTLACCVGGVLSSTRLCFRRSGHRSQ